MKPNTSESHTTDAATINWLEVVRRNVSNLRFGSVQIMVHDGKVTQIESIEKTRFIPTRDNTTRSP